MKYAMYSIMDRPAGLFMTPQLDINDATAKRTFAIQVDNSRQMSFSPNDYDLYKIGYFNDNTAITETISPLEYICNGSSVVGDDKDG